MALVLSVIFGLIFSPQRHRGTENTENVQPQADFGSLDFTAVSLYHLPHFLVYLLLVHLLLACT